MWGDGSGPGQTSRSNWPLLALEICLSRVSSLPLRCLAGSLAEKPAQAASMCSWLAAVGGGAR